MPYQPSKQPRKYNALKGFGVFAAKTGKGLGKVGGGIFKELAKPGPGRQQNSRGTLTSEFIRGPHGIMEVRKAESIIDGASLPLDDKTLLKLRLSTYVQHPEWSHQRHFSVKERVFAEKEIEQLYGKTVASEVKRKWDALFRGKSMVMGQEAIKQLGPMTHFLPSTREGLSLIVKKYDQKPQRGTKARHITNEKLAEFIQQAEQKSSYMGQVLRKNFRIVEEMAPSDQKQRPERLPDTRQVSSANNWGRRNGDSAGQPPESVRRDPSVDPGRSNIQINK